jgi:deoxyribonuclease V
MAYQPGEFYRRELPPLHAVLPVLRGAPARPLFVTSAGLPRADAADLVRRMAGRFRLPDALRRVDTLARTGQ